MFFSFLPTPNKYVFFGLVGSASFLLAPVSAHAGFEWTLPPAQQQAAPPAVEVPAPSVSGPLTPEPDAMLPVPVANVEPQPIVAPEAPQIVAPAIEAPPVQQPVATQSPSPSVPSHVESQASGVVEKVLVPKHAAHEDLVEGFGKDIPLVLALRDIVPPSFAFAFAGPETAGKKISWRGGKPWPQVLQDALAPLDLQASMSGQTVMIGPRSSGYVARMSSPDTIIREVPVEQAPSEPIPVVPSEQPAAAQVSKPSVAPVVDMGVKSKWEARPGSTLRQVLESWCKRAHVELSWTTAYDYPVNNAFYFEGTYGEAVDSLLSSYGGEHPAPKGRLYPNLPDGPSVLMIN